MNKIMILNDEETFTGLDGCMEADVLWDGDVDGHLSDEEWDAKVEELEATHGPLWQEPEYEIIAKIVKVYTAD